MAHVQLLAWSITATGVLGASPLSARVETAVTLSLLLVLSTPWPRLLQALRSLGFPAVIVAMLAMTYRYIFLLLRLASELLEARHARTVRPLKGATGRRMIDDCSTI